MKISHNSIKHGLTNIRSEIEAKRLSSGGAYGSASYYDCILFPKNYDIIHSNANIYCYANFTNDQDGTTVEREEVCNISNFSLIEETIDWNTITLGNLDDILGNPAVGSISFIKDSSSQLFIAIKSVSAYGLTLQNKDVAIDDDASIQLIDPTYFTKLFSITPIKITSSDMYKDDYILVFGPRTLPVYASGASLDSYSVTISTIYMLGPGERPVSNNKDKFYILAIVDYNTMQY